MENISEMQWEREKYLKKFANAEILQG